MADDHRARSWERRTEKPLLAASLVFFAAYALHVLAPGLPGPLHDLCTALALAAWALFAADYAVRLVHSGSVARFVRGHPLDTLVLLLPLLRPLRLVRLYNAVQQRRHRPRLSLYGRVMAYAGLSALLLGFAASLVVWQHERGAPGATIRSFGDSVWWACSTLTTTGYGDVAPVTPAGRVAAVALMACGVGLLSAVTGAFSSWLIRSFRTEDEKRPPEGA
ncbi:potassium channel family protein [Streptomyces olivaceiscleroticus]|uniref:Potassium channel family protein n=1 Tax=Streptomyces olivaceiscleroticus TaxID=68245 RepID=A0ABN1AL70_9ACTN